MADRVNAGDSGRITREYMDSLLVEMRHIDSVEPDTSLTLYGHTFATPVMLAALSHLNGIHPEGMVEAARGVAAANAVMWAGMGDLEELEAICKTGAKTIKIIKPYADNKDIIRRMEHAADHGCIAVGMDIDHAFGSKNKRGSVLDLPMSPKTLDEIKMLVNATKLPFIIKGVLSEQDALKCLEAGVRGIVVSHHHGMVDYAVPPLMVLPRIMDIIGTKIPVFVDCEISRGMDVFKSIALGATAASVGRAAMPPLGESGAAGVTKLFNEMTNELNWAMAVTCCKELGDIDSSLIWER